MALAPEVDLGRRRCSNPRRGLVGFSPPEALDQPEGQGARVIRFEQRSSAALYRAAGRQGAPNERLTDFTTSNGPDVHVLLARSDDESLSQEIVKGQLENVELGPLKREPRRSELRSDDLCRLTEIRCGGYLLRAVPCGFRCGAARAVLKEGVPCVMVLGTLPLDSGRLSPRPFCGSDSTLVAAQQQSR